MAPKAKNNKSQPEKSAELKEGWADKLPLKYDDKTYGDRFGIQFFAENLNSDILSDASSKNDGIIQIFDAFCLMALNSLKTENDVNELKAKASSGKEKNSKANATMDFASLRHAISSHFVKVVANLPLRAEFNTVFFAHLEGNKLPVEFDDYVRDLQEIEDEALDEFIQEKYSSKSSYQREDKVKTYFGHKIFEKATPALAEIVNHFNPLWNPVPPSGKSISDMLRAIKIQRFRAKAHRNAIMNMRKQDGYVKGLYFISYSCLVFQVKEVMIGTWGDTEKLAYVRGVVKAKLETYDPATSHPKFWLAFLLCSYPIDHFTGRRLALPSCVPPPKRREDDPAVMPSSGLQALERNGGTSGHAPPVNKRKNDVESSRTGTSSSTSSFTHTVQLISQSEADMELGHIKDQVATIKEAIKTLEDLDAIGLADEINDLRKELTTAVLHQVKMMKIRTQQFMQQRADEEAARSFASSIVSEAAAIAFPTTTPVSAFTAPDDSPFDAELGIEDSDEGYRRPSSGLAAATSAQDGIFYEDPHQFLRLMESRHGKVIVGYRDGWNNATPSICQINDMMNLRTQHRGVREARQVINLWILKFCFYFKLSWQSFVAPEEAHEALLWDNEFAGWVQTLEGTRNFIPGFHPGTSSHQERAATSSRQEERAAPYHQEEPAVTSSRQEERAATSSRQEERAASSAARKEKRTATTSLLDERAVLASNPYLHEQPAKRKNPSNDVEVVPDSLNQDAGESATFVMVYTPLEIDELLKDAVYKC